MARQKSEDKHMAILEAAAKAVAENGVSATTAQIARAAGVAEGSLFTYFASKDALFNALYLTLKHELLNVFMEDYPSAADVRERTRHVWNANLRWGITSPAKRKAVQQLSVSERITVENKEQGNKMFTLVHALMREAITNAALAALPLSFAGALLASLAETTTDFILANPEDQEKYAAAGFEAFWNAIR
jgi:AcrR family transcriptional regulator